VRGDAEPVRLVVAVRLAGIDPLPSEPVMRARASSAWYTPPDAAAVVARMAYSAALRRPEVAGVEPWRILEPAAGHGALIDALVGELAPSRETIVDAVELDSHAAVVLADKALSWPCRARVHLDDYLERPAPARPYDLAVMNPPYEGGLDSLFLRKAMDESLRVVALVRLALLESQRSYERVWSRLDGEWRLIELRPFVQRPVFAAPSSRACGGKTAFCALKLSRVRGERGTVVGFVR